VKFNYSAWGECSRLGGVAADEWLACFTGKEYDATGLQYFNARYYDPIVGRFLTEDPSRKGHSWYSYCANNPLTFTDPTGMREIVDEDRSGRLVFADTRAARREAPQKERDNALRQARQPAYLFGAQGELLTKLPVLQSDSRMVAMFPDFSVGPCYAMSLIAAWEKTLGRYATPMEVATIVTKAQSGIDPALAKDYRVRDPDAVLSIAKSVLGAPGEINIVTTSNKLNADYSIAIGKSPRGGPHFALADVGETEIVRDPSGPGTIQPGWEKYTYIDIQRPPTSWYMRR
jgi:RHS repeat-associated protein